MARIAIAGATGLVGETLLRVLESRSFPIEELRLFASAQSQGRKLKFRNKELLVEDIAAASFADLDFAFFALSEDLTGKYLPEARKHCLVIDKSSTYRLKPDVPLVVPEVNREEITRHQNLIATPNCTTIPLVLVLSPLHKKFGLKSVVVSSYQSASGAGREGLIELGYETEFLALNRTVERLKTSPFPVQLADNVIPQISKFRPDGYSGEEHKLMAETKKILKLPELMISATCVRVPVRIGHALSVSARFEQALTPDKVIKLLTQAEGLKVSDRDSYPTPIDCVGSDDVFVGRVRKDFSCANGLSLWIVTDNLRKGAATNAVQIAEQSGRRA